MRGMVTHEGVSWRGLQILGGKSKGDNNSSRACRASTAQGNTQLSMCWTLSANSNSAKPSVQHTVMCTEHGLIAAHGIIERKGERPLPVVRGRSAGT